MPPEELYFFAQDFYRDFQLLTDGSVRLWVDEKERKKLVEQSEKVQLRLSDEQNSRVKRLVEREVEEGRLKEADKEDRRRDLEEGELLSMRQSLRIEAAVLTCREVKVPGEPDVVKHLLWAKTAEQVRRICKDAFATREFQTESGQTRRSVVSNWPITAGSVLPYYLSKYASEFVVAKNHRRYPRSDRPSNQLKRLWFLSRALAGALFGIETRTAINLVGSKRPEQVFEESRAAKGRRIVLEARKKGREK